MLDSFEQTIDCFVIMLFPTFSSVSEKYVKRQRNVNQTLTDPSMNLKLIVLKVYESKYLHRGICLNKHYISWMRIQNSNKHLRFLQK